MKCVLKLSEVPLHLYQIIAGFELLKQSGKIELDIKRLNPGSPLRLPYNMLEADIDGSKIIFDMNDGYDNILEAGQDYIEFYNKILARCDLLFKRSYNEELNSKLINPEKIRKTAPNFMVTVKGNPAHLSVPCDPKKEKVKKLIRMIPGTQYYNGYCYEENFRAEPKINNKPKILFMARLWDPAGEFKGQLSEEKSEERRKINESRASCIRLCRNEFRDSFLGGITDSKYAVKEYPDLVIKNNKFSKKNEYLSLMKSFDIHIATMGLHKSTGWKFAEYLAASKAIVSEPLYYSSTGNLSETRNYLVFKNGIDCCEKINELFDEQKRYSMMCANREYYNEFMSCEKLVNHSILNS